jgi:hypothetical protein
VSSIAILEFRENEFIRSVAARLTDVPALFVSAGEVAHPSPPPAPLVIDRVSFCDPFLRHVVRYWSLAGAYVLNNPFFTLVYDKMSELLLYDRLGIRHPRTVLLPRSNSAEDMREIVGPPDWQRIAATVGFPCILKPVDGYAWQDVFRIDDLERLRGLYESLKDTRTLIVQELISYTAYYRAFCVGGSDVLVARWIPKPFDAGEYSMPRPGELDAVGDHMRAKTIELNAAVGLDFNAVEWCITRDGTPVVIDSFNDVPDVRREKLPPECYEWIVDRFCGLVRARLASGARNVIPGIA